MRSDSAETHLFNPDPTAYLPHRSPFLFLDRITTLEKGVQATALLEITSQAGFPRFLMVECVAQLAGILTISEEGEGGFLAAIDHAAFTGNAVHGDTLKISASVVKSFGRLFLVSGCVSCDDRLLLETQLTIGVGRL